MRSRLLRSTLTIALVALVTLGIPLLLLARQQVWRTAQDTVRQQATSAAAGLEDRIDAGLPLQLERYVAATGDRRIVVVMRNGSRTVAGPSLQGPVLRASVTVSGAQVTVEADRHPTVVRAREVTALVGGLSLLAVGAAVALALWQSRLLTLPLSRLNERAEALGRGDFRPGGLLSGITEIDGISAVLDQSARQLDTTIELQRDFASDAAHQLRTPLTGIGLRLDELTRIGDLAVQQEAEEALAQVERLDRVITVLLARARGDVTAPTLLELSAVLQQESSPWAIALGAADRAFSLDLQSGLWVRARPEHLTGILSCLLDNAVRHGHGKVALSCLARGDQVVTTVEDDGPGVPSELVDRVFDRRVSGGDSTGIGLALARSLAGAEGGRLALVQRARFELTLPSASVTAQ